MAAVLSQRSPVIGPTPGNEFVEDYSTPYLLSPAASTSGTTEEDVEDSISDNNDVGMDENEEEIASVGKDENDDDGKDKNEEDGNENDATAEEEKEVTQKDETSSATSIITNKDGEKEESSASSTSPPATPSTTTNTATLHNQQETTPQKRIRRKYKGLRNLGNTCYLNSALQMIFSLDSFMEELEELKEQLDAAVLSREETQEENEELQQETKEEEKVEDVQQEQHYGGDGFGVDLLFGFANDDDNNDDAANDNNDNNNSTNKAETKTSPYPLLDAFLQTYNDLYSFEDENTSTSTTIRNATSPEKLKQILDEKTPLFIGYRQQDSHEFLSTLIDLLDEELKECMLEYRVGDIEEIPQEDEDDDGDVEGKTGEEEDMNVMDETLENSEEEQNQSSQDGHNDEEESNNEKEESLRKKPKHSPQNQSETIDSNVMKRASSLAELNLEAISDLLHGTNTTSTTNTSSPIKKKSLSSPSLCKLAGGRMINPISSSSSSPSFPTVVLTNPTNQESILEEEEDKTISEEEEENNYNVTTTNKTSPLVAAISENNDKTLPTNLQSEETKEETPKKKLQVKTTPLTTTFTTQIRNTLTCDSCCYSRSHIESYNHLSLEVEEEQENDSSSSSPGGGSIEEGLRKFLAEEKREIKCEKCFCESATQRMEIVALPKALLLHLKRFIVDFTPCYTRATYRKNRSAVEFPQVLSLSPPPSSLLNHDIATACNDKDEVEDGDHVNGVLGEFLACDVTVPSTTVSKEIVHCSDSNVVGDDNEMQDVSNNEENDDEYNDNDEEENETLQRYKLRSIVHHIGSSASCGHYKADALRPYDCNNNSQEEEEEKEEATITTKLDWTRFNDSHVSIISKKEAIGPSAQQTAYMVVYNLE